MNGISLRYLMFSLFFTITTLFCCIGDLSFAKAVAPITVYLSKKSMNNGKERFEQLAIVRNIDAYS